MSAWAPFFFAFNIGLVIFSFGFLEADLVLYSLFMSFISSQTLDYVLTVFNQRKMVFIISDVNDRIAKEIILTVVHNYQLKRLEEAALSIDPDAFIITENTFNVMGRGFSKPKVY
jgi:uncharacterized membrane-anchored protein YitT (DUF2179 family)